MDLVQVVVAALVLAFVAYYWRPAAIIAILVLFILLGRALGR